MARRQIVVTTASPGFREREPGKWERTGEWSLLSGIAGLGGRCMGLFNITILAASKLIQPHGQPGGRGEDLRTPSDRSRV